jgi:hypothetical protein
MAKAYENGTGENCALNTTEILVKFPQSGQTHFSEVGIQRDHPIYPGNVRQISAYFHDANGSPILNHVTNEPITWTSPENEPVIRGDFQNVSGVVIKVLNLDNNTINPTIQRLRLQIQGCYSAGLKIRFSMKILFEIFFCDLVKLATFLVTSAPKTTPKCMKSLCLYESIN